MTQAITRCPSCGMTFRVSESQLRVADGAVRCGACLSVFQAEEYFISPPLDVTEQLAIIADYWSDFDRYVVQVAGTQHLEMELEIDLDNDPDVEHDPVEEIAGRAAADEPDETSEDELLVEAPREETYFGVLDPLGVPVRNPSDESDPEGYDAIPVLEEELTPEEVEEAFAVYADAGIIPDDVGAPEPSGQTDLFDAMGEPLKTLAETPHIYFRDGDVRDGFVEETEAGEETVVADYLEYLDQHPRSAVQSAESNVQNTGVTITATRDSRPDEDAGLVSLALGIASDPEEITAPRSGGVTNAMLGWFSAGVVMLLAGCLQYAWFNMDYYSQNERYRPAYEKVCAVLRCEVPPYDKVDLLRTRELIVRTHATEPNALTVDVLLSNNGDFRQLFPGLELTFFNIDGEKTASRVFTVSEYLGGELRGLRFIPARTEVRLSLELVDPGNEALGYQMQVVPL